MGNDIISKDCIEENKGYCEITEPSVGSASVLKRLGRKMTYWLYRPMFEQQSEMNRRLLELIGRTEEKLDSVSRTQDCISENIRNLNRDRQALVDCFASAEVSDAMARLREYLDTLDTVTENVRNLNRDRQALVDCFASAEVSDAMARLREYLDTLDTVTENVRNLNRDMEDTRATQGTVAENLRNLNRDMEDTRATQGTVVENLRNLNRDMDILKSVKCYLPKNDKPRVVQLVSCLNFGDAVGNEVIAFKKFLQENGYVTEIFTEAMSSRLPADTALNYRRMPVLDEDDIVIYHFASQCTLFDTVKQLKCKVVLRYHNVTPPRFFAGYDEGGEKACGNGLSQAAELKNYVDYCLPVSQFNKNDLLEMGYTCPMTVLPILIRFSDYEQTPDKEVVDRYSDGITNILFVGRMAPNKRVEDVISAFARYKEKYDPDARLFLVGSYGEGDRYYRELCAHIEKLGVKDVIFPGHISFAAILAYYTVADVFLCMSEHEGFCVPLVEAMYFHDPIVAYNSSAIPSTLDGCGILLEDKDFDKAADAINDIIAGGRAEEIVRKQDKRLEALGEKEITAGLKSFIESIQ